MKKYLLLPSILFLISSCEIFSNLKTIETFPIYGNWCGPKHPVEGANPATIDMTDLACKNHDLCYDRDGYFNQTCDKLLIAELKNFIPDNIIENKARKAIISYMRKSSKL